MDMHERLKVLIEASTNPLRQYKELEEKTGIAAGTWKTYLTRGVRPSAELVEKVAKAWPKHAFWLVTGITDFDYGHSSPNDVSISTFRELKNNATNEFFLEEIKSSDEKISKSIIKGLKVLDSLDLIDKKQVPATKNAAFYQTVRWIDIFLDQYLLHIPIDAAIEIFNQLRIEVNSLSDAEIDDQQQQLISSLVLKFSSKKEEIERLRNQINLAQDKRIATYDHQAT
jgi:hypothetical protein